MQDELKKALARLNSDRIKKQDERNERRYSESRRRKEIYAEIQVQQPGIAAFISNFHSVFSRATYTEVEIEGRDFVATFPASVEWDGKNSVSFTETLDDAKYKTGKLRCYWSTRN